MSYSSREGANAPELVIVTSGGPTNTPTATNTPGPPSTPTRTPTAGPTSTATVIPTTPPPSFQSAQFDYDGDGKRVKSTINGTISTYFVGIHYEVTGSTVTKYYYAGSQRIAMRAGGVLKFLLGDHLSSTSLVTDANGENGIETRYKAWGEVRYASDPSPTDYTYTGQFSHVDDFGLLFYNARWYDPRLGRFAQADTIIPEQSQGTQAWDRYAYTNNNPAKYVDPSGHCLGPLLLVCIAAAGFIADNAALITTVAVVGAVTSFTTADNPRPELINDPAASQAEFENSLFVSTAWLTAGQAALEFGSAAPPAKIAEGTDETIGPLPESELPNFSSRTAVPTIYDEGTNLYRVHSPGRAYANWWTTEPPHSELQWRVDQAVPPEWGNTAQHVSVLTVPPGGQIGGWSGPASYQGNFYVGGGNQVYLPKVPSQWVKTMDFMEFMKTFWK